MAVPLHKLPALLQNPVYFQRFSKLVFRYPYHQFANNNVRFFYKSKAPLLKYYNTHMKLELAVKEETILKLEIYGLDGQKVGEIENDKNPEQILGELIDIHEDLGKK